MNLFIKEKLFVNKKKKVKENLEEKLFNFEWKIKKVMVMVELVHHFYNRHDGFIQPELVENHHHLDFKIPENGISEFKNN